MKTFVFDLIKKKSNLKEPNYVDSLYTATKDLYERVSTAKKNLQLIISNLQQWNKKPLYIRKKNKSDALLDISNRQQLILNRFKKCRKAVKTIEYVMLENYRLFNDIETDFRLDFNEIERSESVSKIHFFFQFVFKLITQTRSSYIR